MTQSAESDSTRSSKSQGTWWSPIGPTLFGPCPTQLGLGRFFNPQIIICKNWAGHLYQSNQIQLAQWIIIVMMVDVCFSFQLPYHLLFTHKKLLSMCLTAVIMNGIYSLKNVVAMDAYGSTILSKISFICLKTFWMHMTSTFSFSYSTSHVDDKISQTYIVIIITIQDS